jgi:hypothetical protein
MNESQALTPDGKTRTTNAVQASTPSLLASPAPRSTFAAQLATMSPDERVALLSEALQKSEDMLNTMKVKTKDYVAKLKADFQAERATLTADYDEKIKKLIDKVKQERDRNTTVASQPVVLVQAAPVEVNLSNLAPVSDSLDALQVF